MEESEWIKLSMRALDKALDLYQKKKKLGFVLISDMLPEIHKELLLEGESKEFVDAVIWRLENIAGKHQCKKGWS